MDSPEPQAPGSDSSESPTQKQARLRRERREAKIKAGGSSRLDKITQLSGRPAESPPNDALYAQPAQGSTSTPDPDEIDISNHPYTSRSPPSSNEKQSASSPTEADIRALLRSGAPQPGVETGSGQAQQQEEDPMMRLVQQMMGSMGSEAGAEGEGGLPPGLAAMLGGMGAGGGGMPGINGFGQQGQAASSAPGNNYAYMWRILHALYAITLGIFLVSHTSFASSSSRLPAGRSTAPPPASSASDYVKAEQPAVNMFWIFATAELVLQGSRFFLEQGKDRSQGGWLQLVGGILPEPWNGRARLIGQYSGIWNTLVEDAMVILFMLGIVGWWKGLSG